MKLILVGLYCLAVVNAAHIRDRRDVSELSAGVSAYNYVPPKAAKPNPAAVLSDPVQAPVQAAASLAAPVPPPAPVRVSSPIAIPAPAPASISSSVVNEAPIPVAPEASVATVEPVSTQEATVLGNDGYRYKTVRRLRFRNKVRRDVSHLNVDYLPPVDEPTNNYLPPIEPEPSTEAPAPPSPEYLPPEETEAPATELPQDSSVLLKDGYHYKKPDVIPDLSLPREYLPPLEKGVVEAEGPVESAVLADDGYHYRAIKRLRFFY